MFEFKNKTILILSLEDWGINHISKHHYALELSNNNKVYFIHTAPHSEQKEFLKIREINANLHLVHLKNVAKGIFKLPGFLIDFQNKIIINKLYKKLIIKKVDVLWSFDQAKFQDLKQFKANYAIFHPVDYIPNTQSFIHRIANTANIVLSVSQPILDIINTNTPKYVINHGLDEVYLNHIKDVLKPGFIKENKVNIGYVGNLQMKSIDWENLIKLVKENPTLNFVFMGPDKASNLGGKVEQQELIELKKLPNTFFTGALAKNELVKILSYFDVFLLCYNHKKYPIEVSNSHKILEYLSVGKTVVSNFISAYKDTMLIEMLINNSEISDKIKEVVSNLINYNSLEEQTKRINFAKENTYKKQIERIEKLIQKL